MGPFRSGNVTPDGTRAEAVGFAALVSVVV